MNTNREGSTHLKFLIEDYIGKSGSDLEVPSDANQKATACSPSMPSLPGMIDGHVGNDLYLGEAVTKMCSDEEGKGRGR
jgi:hypothetical protein